MVRNRKPWCFAMNPGAPTFAASVREGGVALAVIVAVALVARLITLDSGFWVDEIYALLSLRAGDHSQGHPPDPRGRG